MIILSVSNKRIEGIIQRLQRIHWDNFILGIAVLFSTVAIGISLIFGWIVAYGDTQSHLNISKRVVDSLTPGLAQLGGIWLPLPHLLMLPFVKIEVLYRTGLAGSIVSGIAFVISSIYIFKITKFLTKNTLASFMAFLVFLTNPNMLYLQTTALTEPLLIAFFILSSYYFTLFLSFALKNQNGKLTRAERTSEYINLIFAAFFAFCASLSRYDGWFLVAAEAAITVFVYIPLKKYFDIVREHKLSGIINIIRNKFYITENKLLFHKLQGMIVLFAVLAFVGIFIWFVWDGLILGDPMYFTNSDYSAKAQQQEWLKRGELPAYGNLPLAFSYFFFDSMTNVGIIIFSVFIIGLATYLAKNKRLFEMLFALIFFVPFIFNVLTLFVGQSVIFIPHITPVNFEWRVFNVRYGILMLPAAALFFGLLFYYVKSAGKLLLILLIFIQIGLYLIGYSKVMAWSDGVEGLSASKLTDADTFMMKNYDDGLVLMDDFARSINIIHSKIPMQNIIYIGNKPYWPVSMKKPEKYAKWIVLQKNDAVWNNIYQKPGVRGRMYKYFQKVYTSPDILIFKRNENVKA